MSRLRKGRYLQAHVFLLVFLTFDRLGREFRFFMLRPLAFEGLFLRLIERGRVPHESEVGDLSSEVSQNTNESGLFEKQSKKREILVSGSDK